MTYASVRNARRIASFAALLFLVAGVSGCSKLQARDKLNKGVAAYKEAQYDTAIEFFKQARDLDPNLMKRPSLSGYRLC